MVNIFETEKIRARLIIAERDGIENGATGYPRNVGLPWYAILYRNGMAWMVRDIRDGMSRVVL